MFRPKQSTVFCEVERTASRHQPAPTIFRPVLWNAVSSNSSGMGPLGQKLPMRRMASIAHSFSKDQEAQRKKRWKESWARGFNGEAIR